MKKSLLTFLMCIGFYSLYAQQYVSRNENGSITAEFGIPAFGTFLNDEKFPYDQKSMGEYSLGWFWDSWNTGSPTLWLSSCGGMKFFTAGQPRMAISLQGNVGIGTTSPQAKLHIESGRETDAVVLATSSEYNKLVVRSEDTQPADVPVFRILHEFDTNRENGYINFHRSTSRDGGFLTFGTFGIERMRIDTRGNMGLGTTSPDYKLDVVGAVRAHQVLVNTQKGADFVFEDGYELRPLEEVEQFITENKHLPDIAPASSMEQNGVDMGELQMQLLQKIEELTLYVIELKKENQTQQEYIQSIEKYIKTLEKNKL